MKKVFADSVYWIALINPNDQWRGSAIEASEAFVSGTIVTTDEVLIETCNYFAESGQHFRSIVCREIDKILINTQVEIVDAEHLNFLNGFELYKNRLDKGYSLTDCISMNVCKTLGIDRILTHDSHFRQEGFTTLM